ncbi:MAG: Amuc_1102 family pilus-like protein [Verrucomicrobiales bacterium]
MKMMKSQISTCIALAFGALVLAPSAFAQAYRAKVDKPNFDALPSPEIRVGKDKSFKPRDWLEMEVEFELEAKPEPDDGYIDRLTVQWYVAVKQREGNGFWLLSKNVEHVNVKLDEKLFSSVYMTPNTYERLTGSEKVSKGDIRAVGGILLVNGVKVGTFMTSGNEDQPWWESSAGGLSRTDKFPLLNKNETPFKSLWYDRYAELAEERR